MFVLDTNVVVSELMKAKPDPKVEAWVAAKPPAELFITAITEAELRVGVALLPAGRRRDKLSAAIERMLAEGFAGRILPFESSAAVAYATIAVDRRRAGRPISQSDAQIAAIVKSRDAAIATGDLTDFEGCGIEIINPWNPPE